MKSTRFQASRQISWNLADFTTKDHLRSLYWLLFQMFYDRKKPIQSGTNKKVTKINDHKNNEKVTWIIQNAYTSYVKGLEKYHLQMYFHSARSKCQSSVVSCHTGQMKNVRSISRTQILGQISWLFHPGMAINLLPKVCPKSRVDVTQINIISNYFTTTMVTTGIWLNQVTVRDHNMRF